MENFLGNIFLYIYLWNYYAGIRIFESVTLGLFIGHGGGQVFQRKLNFTKKEASYRMDNYEV